MKGFCQSLLVATTLIMSCGYCFTMSSAPPARAAVTPPTDKANVDSVKEIAAYEQKFFERSFDGETKERRLDRLETFIFGATSTGSARVRIAKIAQVVPLPASAPAKSTDVPSNQPHKPSPTNPQPG